MMKSLLGLGHTKLSTGAHAARELSIAGVRDN